MRYSLSTIKTEVLCGVTVSLALVPEAISFSFAAGVDPIVGLYTSFIVGLIVAMFGGRPGVISGSAGALAVVVVALVERHGLEYLFATVVLAGFIQLLFGALRLGRFIRLVPHPALLGFINGLSIVIIAAQFKQLKVDEHWLPFSELQVMVPLILATMFICFVLPKITKAVPAALVSILLISGIVIGFDINTRTVGDMADIAGSLPVFHIPHININFDLISIILPFAFIVALVGAIENLLLLNMVSDMTEGKTNTQHEVYALGLSNVANGFFGGMGGCGSIGQTMINVSSGARHRLSGMLAASLLMVYVLVGSHLIEMIPVAALVGVMFAVMIRTFVWSSFKLIGKVPLADAMVMLIVTVVTVMTDIATAVIIGSIVSALAFAWKSAQRIHIKDEYIDESGYKVYQLEGPLFFGSSQRFKELFHAVEDPKDVIIDFAHTKVIDQSGIHAIDSLAERYMKYNKQLHLRHLSPDCSSLLSKASRRFVEPNESEDPHYGLVIDYPAKTVI